MGGTTISLSEWKAPISTNFQNYVGAPISTNFTHTTNFQNRRHFDLFFYILNCKNTVFNSNIVPVEPKTAGYNTKR